jgi:(p)ppGpp synthase/HD superfamily hydrolase
LANCCKPIPGDDVFGFVTTGKGLTIHRTNCPNATKLLSNYGHRVVKDQMGAQQGNILPDGSENRGH